MYGWQQMDINEKRQAPPPVSIDQTLIDEGAAQLSGEIEILENWLHELECADGQDKAVLDARNAYREMLRSRKEMLHALMSQSRSLVSEL